MLGTKNLSPFVVLTTIPEIRFGSSWGRSATSRTFPATTPLESLTRVPRSRDKAKLFAVVTQAEYRKSAAMLRVVFPKIVDTQHAASLVAIHTRRTRSNAASLLLLRMTQKGQFTGVVCWLPNLPD
jgi:hypothetical protein